MRMYCFTSEQGQWCGETEMYNNLSDLHHNNPVTQYVLHSKCSSSTVLSHLSIFFFSLPLSAPRSDISREVSKTCKLKEMLLITLLLLLSSSCCPLSCSVSHPSSSSSFAHVLSLIHSVFLPYGVSVPEQFVKLESLVA